MSLRQYSGDFLDHISVELRDDCCSFLKIFLGKRPTFHLSPGNFHHIVNVTQKAGKSQKVNPPQEQQAVGYLGDRSNALDPQLLHFFVVILAIQYVPFL